MTLFQVVVVVRAINVAWNYRSKHGLEFFIVSSVLDIDEAFCVGVPKVRVVWWAIVDHSFIDRVWSFVGEDACRKARNNFLTFKFKSSLQNIVVYLDVLALWKKRTIRWVSMLRDLPENPGYFSCW